ncbi:MAG: putative metal-dependent phosphoesterases (PHP family) [Firmicutes bacterium]|nr:putative metal-dependent phosphoesterases (PHP family) [Bacillota bacterium]MDI6704743.1 PHP domain-containing protein [Bacillota bacterium]
MNSADLHLHTNKSDGLLTPTELVRLASENNLKAIAITDHDSIDGIQEALDAGSNFDLEVIPGIEFNTDADNGELHMLGYFIDHHNEELVEFIKRLKTARFERIKSMVEKLRGLGIEVSLESILSKTEDKAALGRPHIARALVDMGYVESIKDAFNKYIGSGCPAYVARYKLKPSEAIEIIKIAGGVPVLAHPGLLSSLLYIDMCIDEGIQGIEVYHSKHTKLETEKFIRIAEEFSLIPTGGSDCHGECTASGQYLIGTVTVSYDIVESLKSLSCINRKES